MTKLKKLGMATLLLNLSLVLASSARAEEYAQVQEEQGLYASAKLFTIIPMFNLGYKINPNFSLEIGGNPLIGTNSNQSHHYYQHENDFRHEIKFNGFYNAVLNYQTTNNPKYNVIFNLTTFYVPVKEKSNGTTKHHHGFLISPGVSMEYTMTKNAAINFGLQGLITHNAVLPTPTLGLTYKF